MEQGDHIVLMKNAENKEFPLGIGIADAKGEILCFVPLDLHTANDIGQKFCELYNEMLIKVRGDT